MYQIDPEDYALVQEFRDHIYGPYSHECLRMLNRLRFGPEPKRYVLVTVKKYKEWRIGRLPGERGVPIPTEDKIYTNKAEAEWEIFKRRWRTITGQELQEGRLGKVSSGDRA